MVNIQEIFGLGCLLDICQGVPAEGYPPKRYSEINQLGCIKLLLALVLSCVTFSSYATSASSAHIYILPVTYNDKGVVLFKAHKDIDYLGAPSDRKFSYFWIAVSARGVWEEIPHKILKQPGHSRSDEKKSHENKEREQENFWKMAKFYDSEFANELDWNHPPKTLLPLIKKYGFKPRPSFNKNEGKGTVTWSSKGVCMSGKCTKSTVPQRTLGNMFSKKAYTSTGSKGMKIIEVEGKAIQNIFYHAGVALFQNGNYQTVDGKAEETDGDPVGAEFDFNKNEMIDYNYIDAISIVPASVN